MIAACVALPISLFAYQGYTSYATTWANADLEIARTRDIAREHAVKVLETIERSLSEINEIVRGRSDDEIRANAQFFHDRLAVIDDALPQMKSAWILDAGGHVLATSLSFPASPESFADRDYFSAHRDRDVGIYLGPILTPRAPYSGLPFFSMSRRRSSDDGAFNGVLQASILPDYFEQFYRQIGFEPGSFVGLALTGGMVLASHPTIREDAQIPADSPMRREIIKSPRAGLFTARFAADGAERRVAYQKLDAYPVYVAAALTTDAIRARWIRDFAGLLLIGIPGTVLLLGLLWLFLQGTKRLYAESASRERAETALRENQRLEALGQLTGGVAHDFNNLLTVIGSSADLLRRGTLSAERQGRYLDAISETVKRATNLTAQLLAFARRQPLRLEVFDASTQIGAMADVLQTLLGSTILLRIQQGLDPSFVETDESQFETAIINLAANARDAMPGGGAVTIAVGSADDLPERLRQGPSPAGGYVTIAFVDTGTGIPADQVDRVFEPFFTTKDVGRGTGLGLSQVFGFVKQSLGEIAVDSVAGTGTTFTLYLPRAIEKTATLSSASASSPLVPERLRILLIDDNEAILQATGDALRARGLSVSTAANAEAALARLARPDAAFDVVLTDIVMPGMNGIDLAKTLRRNHPRISVVVTTGYSETIEQEGEGDLTLIRKPYSIDDLVATLAGATRQHAAA